MNEQKIVIDLDKLGEKSDAEIKDLAHSTKKLWRVVKAELKSRKLHFQHDNIDHLEEHLESTDSSFSTLRKFIQLAVHERKD